MWTWHLRIFQSISSYPTIRETKRSELFLDHMSDLINFDHMSDLINFGYMSDLINSVHMSDLVNFGHMSDLSNNLLISCMIHMIDTRTTHALLWPCDAFT